jgi:hypothetical protein
MIIAAREDMIVDIYDAVTFVLQQSLRAPEMVRYIRGSPDGSTLFIAHFYSITLWDVQTGGLTHTFTSPSQIANIAVSTTGDHLACSFDYSIVFWNIRTKEKGTGFWKGEQIVAIDWMSPQELAVATRTTVYIHNIVTGETSNGFSIPSYVWGMVYLRDPGEFLVGTWQLGLGADQERCFLKIGKSGLRGALVPQEPNSSISQPLKYHGELRNPTLADEEIVCITQPSGVQSFDLRSQKWTENPPLLDAATSVTVSLNRNLVAQTIDSIQIFSLDVLKSGEARNIASTSHAYPLGEKHVICLLQPNRHLTILDLGTLQELRPDDGISPLQSLLNSQSLSARGLVAEFGVSAVVRAWQSRTPLPEWDQAVLLGGSSPDRTRMVTFSRPLWEKLHVKDAKDGTILADPALARDDLEKGEVYDVTFDSETRFHLKVDGPGRHVQIPCEILPSPLGHYSHTITKGEPVALSEPRKTPSYALDVNCEWVVDAKSRKICWISPGNVRRGEGGHFWAGLELVMVGDDGVVRKLSFKEPDC